VVLTATFFRAWRAYRRGLDAVPTPGRFSPAPPGRIGAIILMLASLILFIIGFTMGGLNYVVTVAGRLARAA